MLYIPLVALAITSSQLSSVHTAEVLYVDNNFQLLCSCGSTIHEDTVFNSQVPAYHLDGEYRAVGARYRNTTAQPVSTQSPNDGGCHVIGNP